MFKICCCRNIVPASGLGSKEFPVFCITGPPLCGKSAFAKLLAEKTKFKLIELDILIYSNENNAHVKSSKKLIKLISDEILINISQVEGFIIDGFPRTLSQAIKFERKVCPISALLYVTLQLDFILARRLNQTPNGNLNEMRVAHVRYSKITRKVYRYYNAKSKATVINAHFPKEITFQQFLRKFEDEFEYKFRTV